MSAPSFADPDIDVELLFDRFLDKSDLSRLQKVLAGVAEEWSADLRVWRGPGDEIPVAGAAGLASAVAQDIAGYGVDVRCDDPVRILGKSEIRGRGRGLTVVLSVDEVILAPVGPKKVLGNAVALQVRARTLEGLSSSEWATEAFQRLCRALDPAWGYAAHPREYWAAVMADSPAVRAVGRDLGRWLPGLFWLNFFGRGHLDLLGAETFELLSDVSWLGKGALVSVGAGPADWNEPKRMADKQHVLEVLGRDLFFDKAEPDRPGRIPRWL